jgi:signal transduction histidine kinase
MTREEALRGLKSSSMHERLRAARFFMNTAQPQDFAALTAALAIETVVWVRSALQMALERAGGTTASKRISSRVWEDVEPEDEAYARAVEDTTRRLVHEIEPIVGIVRLHARLEIPNFAESRTARALSRLIDTITAVSVLGKVSAVPQVREFDLAELIRSVAESEAASKEVMVEFAGLAPLIAVSDPAIVSIVVANGTRNAIEATLAGSRTHLPVVVNWGSTSTEYWIVILDNGIGLPLSAGRVYEIGTTTKSDHLGMGLAVCYRAARTLGGQIVLGRRDEVGASFEFRWPRPYTES